VGVGKHAMTRLRILTSILTFVPVAAMCAEICVIPQPASLEMQPGSFTVRADTAIVAGAAAREAGHYLAAALKPSTGYSLKVIDGADGGDNSVVLAIDAGLSRLGEEGYSLEVTPRRIVVRASQAAGVFHGVETLRQLLPPAVYAREVQKGVTWSVPCLRIEDQPRFRWRGALLDVARHFQPKEVVLKFIDLLALHKMNSLQLHLTDDQGWRIEIKRYPELTRIGSRRSQTRVGHERDGKGFDGKPHGGFYTQADIREIVAYARERHVRVVPEIEMPGHTQAAIASYPELGNTEEKLEVGTSWGVYKNVLNVNEKTIHFMQGVLEEVMALFPSEFIHVGGDEVPTEQWQASPAAQARMRELGLKREVELHGYFIRRMDEFLTSRGRRLVGWDEILEGGVAPSAVVMSWRGSKGGITAARAQHDVVMAPNTHTYFDYYQAKDPGEPLAIGGFLPLETVYSFDPIPSELTAEEARHILGTQGQLWSEYLKTPEQLEYMAFPRLTALSEVAWTPKERNEYPGFLKRLRIHEERLRQLGVNFRPVAAP